MEDTDFYLEYKNRQNTVVAINPKEYFCVKSEAGELVKMYAGIFSLYSRENSPVASATVPSYYLEDKCVKIPEEVARVLHPALFEYLDNSD